MPSHREGGVQGLARSGSLTLSLPQCPQRNKTSEDSSTCSRRRKKKGVSGVSLTMLWDFPGGAVVKNPPANAGDMGSSPGPRRSHVPGATRSVRHNY